MAALSGWVMDEKSKAWVSNLLCSASDPGQVISGFWARLSLLLEGSGGRGKAWRKAASAAKRCAGGIWPSSAQSSAARAQAYSAHTAARMCGGHKMPATGKFS